MRLVELKNLLLHLFVLTGCEPPLADVIQRPRLVGFVVAEFRLWGTRTRSRLAHGLRDTCEPGCKGRIEIPAVCTSPAGHEWQMSKAVDLWPRRHAAADTTGTCRQKRHGTEKLGISHIISTSMRTPSTRDGTLSSLLCFFTGALVFTNLVG